MREGEEGEGMMKREGRGGGIRRDRLGRNRGRREREGD